MIIDKYLLTIVMGCCCVALAQGRVEPDPRVVLQGIEASREALPASRLQMRADYHGDHGLNRANLTVDFEGMRRRYVVGPGRTPERGSYDGEQIKHYDGINSVTLRPVSKPTSNLLFDPRLLGLTTTYWCSETLAEALRYRTARTLELVGREQEAGEDAWHIRWIDEYQQQVDMWVLARDLTRVVRYDFSIPGHKRNTTKVFYDDAIHRVLPARVTTHYYNRHDQLTDWREITVSQVESGVHLPRETWELSGLSPAINSTVSDIQQRVRLGYWNGKEVQRDPVDVVKVGE